MAPCPMLVLFRAVLAAPEHEDQRIAALEFLAKRADGAGVAGSA
jgi:hypothetical protein